HGQSVMVIGHQKGRDTNDKIFRNFGMPRPEGYRKALRLMKLAEKFGIPLLTFVDTPGAYPGIGAEERGQSEAIGRNLYAMAGLRVPVVVSVIGEGGSGGALAIAVGDVTLMMQYSTYSLISPAVSHLRGDRGGGRRGDPGEERGDGGGGARDPRHPRAAPEDAGRHRQGHRRAARRRAPRSRRSREEPQEGGAGQPAEAAGPVGR